MGLEVLAFLSHLLQRCHHAFRLRSRRILPSISGSRLTKFYRSASSALLQLVNQWLNFTYSRSLTLSATEKKKQILFFTRIRPHNFHTSVRDYLLEDHSATSDRVRTNKRIPALLFNKTTSTVVSDIPRCYKSMAKPLHDQPKKSFYGDIIAAGT